MYSSTLAKRPGAFVATLAGITFIAGSGCGSKKKPEVAKSKPQPQGRSTEASKSYSAADLSPIVKTSSYTMVTQEVGGPSVEHRFVKVTTTIIDEPGPSDCPGVQWASDQTRTKDDGSTKRFVVKGCQGEKGDGYYAVSVNGGPEQRFATKIQLPPTMMAGDSWAAVHEGSGSPSYRSCEVRPPTVCEEGIDLECVTKFDNRTVWIRDHYCLGEGWMGQVSVLAFDDRGEVTRSVDIVSNGKSKRDVSQLEHPLPTLEEARAVSQEVKDELLNTP